MTNKSYRGPRTKHPSFMTGSEDTEHAADQPQGLSDRQEMDQRQALYELKNQIEESMYALELLQRKHRSLTGVPHVMPFYLTDPRNRKTLKPNNYK